MDQYTNDLITIIKYILIGKKKIMLKSSSKFFNIILKVRNINYYF